MKNLRQILRHSATLLASVAIAIMLAGCVGSPRTAIESADDVGTNQVIVVGQVTLIPPIEARDQKLSGFNKRLINRILLLTSYENRPLKEAPRPSDFDGRIEATPGQTFVVTVDAKPLFLRTAVLWLNDGAEQAYFPANFQIPLQAGDKAVYIGTIEYHRDEFFNIKRVRVIDDYDKASRDLKERLGAKAPPMRKVLLSGARSGTT